MSILHVEVTIVVETLQYIRLAYQQQYHSQHPATSSLIQQFSFKMSYKTSIADSGSEVSK